MRWFSFWICLCIVIFDTNGVIVPDEIPTALSVIYSNIPKIELGSDSRIGWGFRFGDRADVQFILELGPQHHTQPLVNQQPFDNPNYPELSSSLDTEDYDDIPDTSDDDTATKEENEENIEERENESENQTRDETKISVMKIEIDAMDNLLSKLTEKISTIISRDHSQSDDKENKAMNTLRQKLEDKIHEENINLKNLEETMKTQQKQKEKEELKELIVKLKNYIERTSQNQGNEKDEVTAIEVGTLKQLIQRLSNLSNTDVKKDPEEIVQEKLVDSNMETITESLQNEENSVRGKSVYNSSAAEDNILERKEKKSDGDQSVETNEISENLHDNFNRNETVANFTGENILKSKDNLVEETKNEISGEKSIMKQNITEVKKESRITGTESAMNIHGSSVNAIRNEDIEVTKEKYIASKEGIDVMTSESEGIKEHPIDSSSTSQYEDDNFRPLVPEIILEQKNNSFHQLNTTAVTVIKFTEINKAREIVAEQNKIAESNTAKKGQLKKIDEDSKESENKPIYIQNLIETVIQSKEETDSTNATENLLKIPDQEITEKINTTVTLLNSDSEEINSNMNLMLRKNNEPIIDSEKLSKISKFEEAEKNPILRSNKVLHQVNNTLTRNITTKSKDKHKSTSPRNQRKQEEQMENLNKTSDTIMGEQGEDGINQQKSRKSKNQLNFEGAEVNNSEEKDKVSFMYDAKKLKQSGDVNFSKCDEKILFQPLKTLKMKLREELPHLNEKSESQRQEFIKNLKIFKILEKEKEEKLSEETKKPMQSKDAHNFKNGFIMEVPYKGVNCRAFKALSTLWIQKDTVVNTMKTACAKNTTVTEVKSEFRNNIISTMNITQVANKKNETSESNVREVNQIGIIPTLKSMTQNYTLTVSNQAERIETTAINGSMDNRNKKMATYNTTISDISVKNIPSEMKNSGEAEKQEISKTNRVDNAIRKESKISMKATAETQKPVLNENNSEIRLRNTNKVDTLKNVPAEIETSIKENNSIKTIIGELLNHTDIDNKSVQKETELISDSENDTHKMMMAMSTVQRLSNMLTTTILNSKGNMRKMGIKTSNTKTMFAGKDNTSNEIKIKERTMKTEFKIAKLQSIDAAIDEEYGKTMVAMMKPYGQIHTMEANRNNESETNKRIEGTYQDKMKTINTANVQPKIILPYSTNETHYERLRRTKIKHINHTDVDGIRTNQDRMNTTKSSGDILKKTMAVMKSLQRLFNVTNMNTRGEIRNTEKKEMKKILMPNNFAGKSEEVFNKDKIEEKLKKKGEIVRHNSVNKSIDEEYKLTMAPMMQTQGKYYMGGDSRNIEVAKTSENIEEKYQRKMNTTEGGDINIQQKNLKSFYINRSHDEETRMRSMSNIKHHLNRTEVDKKVKERNKLSEIEIKTSESMDKVIDDEYKKAMMAMNRAQGQSSMEKTISRRNMEIMKKLKLRTSNTTKMIIMKDKNYNVPHWKNMRSDFEKNDNFTDEVIDQVYKMTMTAMKNTQGQNNLVHTNNNPLGKRRQEIHKPVDETMKRNMSRLSKEDKKKGWFNPTKNPTTSLYIMTDNERNNLQKPLDKTKGWYFSSKNPSSSPYIMTDLERSNHQKPLGGRVMTYISKILQEANRKIQIKNKKG